MIYEIRTYTLTPGSIPEFEKRFEKSLTNRLKYSELAAFWHTDIGPLNQVIHVWPYENLEHRAETRQRALQEQDWPPNTGEFIVSMQSEIFNPAPFSPKLGGGQKLGNIYEMRMYQYQPGAVKEVTQRWEKGLAGGRLEISPIAACMWSEVGRLNFWVHIWPYDSMEERDRVREESFKLETWPPGTREFMVSMENKIMMPATFSPTA